MKKLCKNCESFAVDEDGKKKCRFLDVERDDFSTPPPESACWKKRPKLSGSELSKVRSEAGKKGGRPKGYGKGRSPTRQASLRLMDHQVLSAYSEKKQIPLAQTVHLLCRSLIKQYPDLNPEGWVD